VVRQAPTRCTSASARKRSNIHAIVTCQYRPFGTGVHDMASHSFTREKSHSLTPPGSFAHGNARRLSHPAERKSALSEDSIPQRFATNDST
jgi:hypothetical protein